MDAGNLKKPPGKRGIQLTSLVIGGVIYLLMATLYLFNPPILDDIEGRLLDARFKLRGEVANSGLVSIVAVDEKSLEEVGRWPWSREILANLISRISDMGAEAIGLDIVFSEPQQQALAPLLSSLSLSPDEKVHLRQILEQNSPDRALIKAIQSSGRIVNGQFFYRTEQAAKDLAPLTEAQEISLMAQSAVSAVKSRSETFPALEATAVRMNIPEIYEVGNGAGFFNFIKANDGTIRNATLLLRYKDDLYPSLALKTLAFYLDNSPIIVHAAEYGIDHISLGGIEIPTNEQGGFVLNFRGPAGTISTYSAVDILQGKVPAEALAGKMVLLGVTAIGVYDAHTTPFGPGFPGLEIQANVAENIIFEDYIQHSSLSLISDLAVIFVIILILVLMLPRINGLFTRFFISCTVILVYAWLTLYLFTDHRQWMNLTYPILAWLVTLISISLYMTLLVERRFSTVNTAFQYYLHPELVKELTHNPELLQFGGEQKNLSILFSDIRSFTNLSEGLSPQQLAKFIHCYMDPMTEVVLNNQGTLDKYIGDAVMALFGAPIPVENHAEDACNAALDMIERLDNIVHCCPELADIFPINIGVGIHSGDVVVGNLGSSFHFTYTALGDNVNLASRVEGLTKAYGVHVLITEDTHEQIQDRFVTRELDMVRVKGKQLPIRIYELMSRQSSAGHEQYLARWYEGLAHFKARDWHEAKAIFSEIENSDHRSKSSQMYIERCDYYIKTPPPEEWDGVTTFTTK